jgi:hypothetical protein
MVPSAGDSGRPMAVGRIRAGISGLALRVTGLHGAVPLSGLTASVGVAAFPRNGDGVEALFAAKSGGRNQVRLAAPATTGRSRTLG